MCALKKCGTTRERGRAGKATLTKEWKGHGVATHEKFYRKIAHFRKGSKSQTQEGKRMPRRFKNGLATVQDHRSVLGEDSKRKYCQPQKNQKKKRN